MEYNAAKITSDVNNKTGEFKDLFDRHDKDYERWKVKKSAVKQGFFDIFTKTSTRATDIQVVSNAPRTFADDVQSTLSSATRQIIVRMAETQGEDMRESIGKLERLLEYAFEKADERLIGLLMPTLMESSVWYSIVRGWIAGRFLVYKDGKDTIFDFLPYDPRWLVYQRGANGLLWTGYTTSHSPEELEDEYGKEVGAKPWWKPWEKSEKSYDVIDYWRYVGYREIMNAIICRGEFLKEPEIYTIDSMPVLITPVATRPPVRGSSGSEIEGYGDSIFAPNREVDDLENQMNSIWASHAHLLAKQPLFNYIDEEGKPLDDTLFYAGGVFNFPMGHQEIVASPMKEISPTLVNFVNMVDSWRVRGSLPDIDISTPPPSGTLYNLVQETSNRVFNPQLRNLASFYSNACRLIEEQLLAGGVSGGKINKLKIQGIQKKEYYEYDIKPVDLKRPHIIKVEFTARTAWQQLDTYQLADMARRLGLPDGFIYEYILKIPDPKGLGDQSAIEMAEHSPKLAIVRAIQAFMKQGRQDEAEQLMRDLYNMEMQEQLSGRMEQTTPTREAGTPARTLPLAEGQATA